VKRGELAPEELDKVIKLKQIGTSWLKIQHETGISRRTAKRAYEKWQHSQSPEVLREARKDVAAKAFLDHLKSLTTLAGSLVTNLNVPPSIADMEKNTEQFFAWLWQQNLLWRGVYLSPETQERYNLSQVHVYTMGDPQCFLMGDPQFNVLENQLLFKCLQDHTRGEGVRWETLDEWGKARDNCAKIVPKLRKETSVVVDNFLNQEREANFLQRVKEESVERGNAVEQMAKAVFSAIWQGIREDMPAENLVRMVSPRGGGQGIVKVKDETFLIFNDTGLAEKVVHTCKLAANNLCKGEMVQQLHSEVRKMEKATEELRQMLNPVRLTPMILRTRCDLCPA
jgi:hypothetical protein